MWFISDLPHMWPLEQGMPQDFAVLNIRAAPPEMVNAFAEGDAEVPATVKWDAWQLGLLAYELALGSPLFDSDLPAQFVQMMLNNQSPLPWEVSEVCNLLCKFRTITHLFWALLGSNAAGMSSDGIFYDRSLCSGDLQRTHLDG
jgi:hypothetical protein